MPGPAGQTEAIHSDGGDGGIGDLELHAGVDGAALIFRNGKQGAGNQLLQPVLGDPDGSALIHIGQLGVILGRFGGNGEGGVAGTDGDLEAVVHHHGDGAFRQTADDIAEELGRQDAVAGVGDFSFDLISNGSFHIIAGEGQVVTGPAQNTFDDGKAALGSNGPAGNIQALDQHAFFTGKTHSFFPFLIKIIRYIYLS